MLRRRRQGWGGLALSLAGPCRRPSRYLRPVDKRRGVSVGEAVRPVSATARIHRFHGARVAIEQAHLSDRIQFRPQVMGRVDRGVRGHDREQRFRSGSWLRKSPTFRSRLSLMESMTRVYRAVTQEVSSLNSIILHLSMGASKGLSSSAGSSVVSVLPQSSERCLLDMHGGARLAL